MTNVRTGGVTVIVDNQPLKSNARPLGLACVACCLLLFGCVPEYRPVTLFGIQCKRECSMRMMACDTTNPASCSHGLGECYSTCADEERLTNGHVDAKNGG